MTDFNGTLWLASRVGLISEQIFASCGVATNLFLFVASCRTRSLRSNCNMIITWCALFDSIHSLGSLVEFPSLFGYGIRDSFTCSALLFLPEFAVYAGCFCVFSIGVDRFLSIAFLSFYSRMHKGTYLTIHLFCILIFSSYSTYLMVAYYNGNPVACSIPAVFHGAAQPLWSKAMLSVNILTLILYVFIWNLISSRKTSSYSRRLFRSLLLVMIFDVGGWVAAVSTVKVLYTIDISDETRFDLRFFAGCFVHFGIAIKPVIYYITSAEYRAAFLHFLFAEQSTVIIMRKSTNSGHANR